MKVLPAPEAMLFRFGFPHHHSDVTLFIASYLRVRFLLLALLLLGLSSGCGKKGDPLPPLRVETSIIEDLRAENRADGILLSWSIPRVADRERRLQFRVMRTKGPVPCKECMEEWNPITDIRIDSQKHIRRAEGRMEYLDSDVSEGTIYRYRVMSVTDSGEISPPSSTVQIRRSE